MWPSIIPTLVNVLSTLEKKIHSTVFQSYYFCFGFTPCTTSLTFLWRRFVLGWHVVHQSKVCMTLSSSSPICSTPERVSWQAAVALLPLSSSVLLLRVIPNFFVWWWWWCSLISVLIKAWSWVHNVSWVSAQWPSLFSAAPLALAVGSARNSVLLPGLGFPPLVFSLAAVMLPSALWPEALPFPFR